MYRHTNRCMYCNLHRSNEQYTSNSCAPNVTPSTILLVHTTTWQICPKIPKLDTPDLTRKVHELVQFAQTLNHKSFVLSQDLAKVLGLRHWILTCSHRFEIGHVDRQQCCQADWPTQIPYSCLRHFTRSYNMGCFCESMSECICLCYCRVICAVV